MAAEWLAKLQLVGSSAPAGTNPYAFVAQVIPNHVAAVGDANRPAFLANMAIVIVIYTFCFFVTVCTLLYKARAGSLWLFRTRSTLHGSVIVPNTMALFTFWSMLFTGFSCIYIGLIIASSRHQLSSIPAQSVMSLIWQPMVLSLFSEGFGMVVALYLAKPEHTFFGHAVHANWINIPAVAFYIMTPAALIPLFALAAYKTQMALNDHTAFYAWLSAQATSWDGSSTFVLTDEASGIVNSMINNFESYIKDLGNGFKVFFVFILAAAIFFVPAAFGYLRLLRSQMNSRVSERRPSMSSAASKKLIGSGSSGTTMAISSRQTERLESLTESYRLMVVETILVLFVTFAYLVLNGWAGWFMDTIVANPVAVIYQHALFYYIGAVFLTPINCLIAYRSYKSYKSEQAGSRFGSSHSSDRFRKIAIQTETATCVNSIEETSSMDKTIWLDKLGESESRSSSWMDLEARQ